MLVPEGATSKCRGTAVSKGTDAVSFPYPADSSMVEGKWPLFMFKVLLNTLDRWARQLTISPCFRIESLAFSLAAKAFSYNRLFYSR